MKRILADATGKPLRIKTSGEFKGASRKVRVPSKFEFLLLEKVIADLGFATNADELEGEFDISLIHNISSAVRQRDHVKLLEALADYSPQSIGELAGGRKGLFFAIYQVCCLLKKYPSKGSKARDAALSGFLKYERICKTFNLENHKALLRLDRSHPDYVGIIDEIREDIERLIGTGPNIQRIFECSQHGPGSAIGLDSESGMVTSFFKWSTIPYTVSRTARPYAQACIESDPRWIGALLDRYRNQRGIPQWSPVSMDDFWNTTFQEVEYCRYTSVPKNALTERPIAIEPTLNVFLQLGVDKVIKSRLRRRWGLDLHSQERNRVLAHEGSLSGLLATLDLSGASDTVTRLVCFLLLPALWYDFLDDIRSKNIRMPDGIEVPLSKFSAMGNGFTFALETVIFGACVRAAMRRTGYKGSWSAFGDDLIVPTGAYPFLVNLLELFGFIVNDEKSFNTGSFRESCGKDYLSGTLVRPLFLKKPIENVNDLFYLYNSLYRMEEDYWHLGVDFRETRKWLFRFIPKEFRYYYGKSTSDVSDTHFYSRRPPLRFEGRKVCLRVVPVSPTFNSRTEELLFRKLMHNLKGKPVDQFGFTTASGGSAFDITLRGVVTYKRSLGPVWS